MRTDKNLGLLFPVPCLLDNIDRGRVSVDCDNDGWPPLEDLVGKALIKAESRRLDGNSDTKVISAETSGLSKRDLCRYDRKDPELMTGQICELPLVAEKPVTDNKKHFLRICLLYHPQ